MADAQEEAKTARKTVTSENQSMKQDEVPGANATNGSRASG